VTGLDGSTSSGPRPGDAAADALVIGGTGPSGAKIVERMLAAGYRVTILHTGAHEVPFSGPVEHIHADPRSLDELQTALDKRHQDVAVATSGRIRHVVDVLRGRVRRLVAISGLPVYRGWLAPVGGGGIPVPIRESDAKEQDVSEYGHRVVQGERAVMDAHHAGDFEATILRYTMVYGPYSYIPFEWFIVRRILDRRRAIALEADGLMVPQRGYADNLALAVMLALEHPAAAGRDYNVGDEQSLSVRSLVELIADTLEHEWDLVPVPLRHSPCRNPFALRQNTLLDMSRIRAELGYRDALGVIEATQETVRWLVEHPIGRESAEEARLGSSAFDYAAEDLAIDRFRSFYDTLEERYV
jgi:nucleoside-diphosphate-sugar epimerase